MKLQNKGSVFLLGLFFLSVNAQVAERPMAVEEVVQLALENHSQLKMSVQNINIAKQQTKVVELQKLPSISASASAFYLGDALLLDPDFSKVATVPMPHFGNTYGVQASQLIFKGGLVKRNIEMYRLREQISELDLQRDRQNIKFLVTANFLDIERLINQRNVYLNNRKLAQQRLENVRKFYQQGMVTRNEVIRGELMIKNLDQAILILDNNRATLNYQLATAIGISPEVLIKPVQIMESGDPASTLERYLAQAHANNPALQSAQASVAVAEKNQQVAKSERMPTVAAFAGYAMNRPVTNATPALNMYSNAWQAGLSFNYNIDNLYKSRDHEALADMQAEQARNMLKLQTDNTDISVNAAFLKYKEAIKQAEILKESEVLANENYRIIEAKYLNQLALQADMTDAQNAKLEAELQYTNAEINVIYQYYNLLKSVGTL